MPRGGNSFPVTSVEMYFCVYMNSNYLGVSHGVLSFVVLILQSELENLSFMYVSAEDYDRVTSRIANLYKEHEKELSEVISISYQL